MHAVGKVEVATHGFRLGKPRPTGAGLRTRAAGDDEAFSLQRVGEHDANRHAYSAGFRLTCCCV